MQRASNRSVVRRPRLGRIVANRWTGTGLGLGVLMAILASAQPPQQAPTSNPDKPYLIPEANRLPDKNDQMEMQDEQSKKANFQAANVERKRQIADDTAKLLELATQLKAEVDKTSKDTLSINVIRKAESIEKLAHGVKEKMKLTMGAS
jgi:hypothetical protein